jgi:hypothetical protein
LHRAGQGRPIGFTNEFDPVRGSADSGAWAPSHEAASPGHPGYATFLRAVFVPDIADVRRSAWEEE